MRATRVQLVNNWNINEPPMYFYLDRLLCSQQDDGVYWGLSAVTKSGRGLLLGLKQKFLISEAGRHVTWWLFKVISGACAV